MEMTKKSLMLSLFSIFVCLIAGVVCACVCKFNTVSIILLVGIVVTCVVANVLAWRIVKVQNRN